MSKGIVIIYFSDYWDKMWRRRQQLAWRLVQNDLIKHLIYIERPLPVTSFLKFLMGQADRDGMDRWRRVLHNRSWVMPVGEKLSVLTTFAPLPPVGLAELFQVSEWIRDRWLLFRLSELKKRLNMDPLVAWVSHPQLSVEVIQALKPHIVWYDCTEDFTAWPGLSDCVRGQIEATDRWLTEHADVVTTVSRTLYEEKRKINSNTHSLPNAVDTDLFLQPWESFRVPRELQGLARPVLAFVGGLNQWAHDWNLLDHVARLRPKWTILLIGELSVSRKTQKMLQGHPNILCVGQKTYRELPPYLVHSDVCFQFYRPSRKNDTGNSQKLFLYLASGKPVVSTPSADAMAYAEYISLTDVPLDFVAAVEEALHTNSPKKAHARQEMARANSWEARMKQISCIFDNMRKP